MSRRYKSLFVIVLGLSIVSLIGGCTQTDDILTSIFRSELHLAPERLPSAPDGMIYSLWVAQSSTGQGAVYIDQFGYDQDLVRFLDVNGAVRADSNFFVFEGDIFDYGYLLVAVEVKGFSTASPGSIMLVDDVTLPIDDPIKLRFPMSDSLWTATVRYNMETTSDDNPAANDGFGLWFCNYRIESDTLRDTLALTSFSIDSTIRHSLPAGTTADTSIIDTVNYLVDTSLVVLGQDLDAGVFALDTVQVIKVNFDFIFSVDVDSPWVHYTPTFVYDTGPLQTFNEIELFSQDDFGLVDYSSWGWKYKGWVLSPSVDSSTVTTRFTPPAWVLGLDLVFKGTENGMLTTGKFADIKAPDEANPHADTTGKPFRTPPFPGEDFLNALPGAIGTLPQTGLLADPPGTATIGTVFLSLEPDNALSDTTNFPLIPFVGSLPASTNAIVGAPSFTLTGKMQTNDPYVGFPSIGVSFKRF